jgi:phosphatidylinositol alpha-1,6-mannosyltransferase
VILTVGRLVERKGHDIVIRALPAIVERVPTARYLIVGNGPNETALRQLVRDVGLDPEQVRFCGRIPAEQLAAYYSLCDAFVMPNREVGADTEGFGIVFIEAGACRKPCVGGQSGGAGDAIIDGETGILVDPTSPSAVARATISLLTDSQLSARLGGAARSRIETNLQYSHVADNILAQCISTASNLVRDSDQVLT